MGLSTKQQECKHLAVIFYLYAGAIVPPFAARKIQDAIKRVETAVQSGHDLLLWVHIDKQSEEAILRSLESWQKDIKSTFPVGMMVAMCTKHFNDTQAGFYRNMGMLKHSGDCQMEIKNFRQTGALWPPASVAEVHEPLLQIDRKTGWKNGKAYVCHYWEVNVTLIDDG